MGFADISIHRRSLLIILIVMLAMFSASAFETRTGTMHLSSTVPRSSGVEVPEGAILVGNLIIQYSYGGSEWEYVTEALVDVPDLGVGADEIWLQVSYYGNEPSDYNCSVDFTTGGWNRQDGYSLNQQSRAGELVTFDNENADLPISFENLNVSVVKSDLHQYGGWTPLTDVLQMTAIDNNVVQATRILASQAGRTLDAITRDVLAGGTNVIYAPKVGSDGAETAVTSRAGLDLTCKLTPKLFFQAAAQLGAMNADTLGDSYVAIIHPYAAYDLKTSKEWICTAARSASWATSASSRPARPRSGRTTPVPPTAAAASTPSLPPWCWAPTPTA